jgi:trehalose 6-phosphate synthase
MSFAPPARVPGLPDRVAAAHRPRVVLVSRVTRRSVSRPSSVRADLVIVANRLPVDRIVKADGSSGWRRSPGGLVSALAPVMAANQGAWIGWPGDVMDKCEIFEHEGITLVPVGISQLEYEEYYEGFSNATLWPLYHDVVAKPEFHREWWDAYVAVNRRFAETAAQVAAPGATVWVQDYQLQLVPAILRELRSDLRIGFFLHIPFPPPELFSQLPWRRELLEGLLGADLVGFQLSGAAQNFIRLVRQRVGHKTHRDTVYLPDGRVVTAKAFPISIDTSGLEELAASAAVQTRAKQIRADLGNPRKVFLGIDRLDYTKGIYARLRAFSELIHDGHFTVEEAAFVQVASPSRERVDQYRRLRNDIDRLVGHINGDLGRIGRPAISYLNASFPQSEMAALYVASDIMVVTPFRDGMNLVAKEYVACRLEDDGALVLSEFAGAANELRQAFLVNPYDINGMKAQMLAAYEGEPKDLARRMRAMRRTVRENDVSSWASAFLSDLGRARNPHDKRVRPAGRN